MNTPKPRIYVVEDNYDIGFVLELFLNDEGFEVRLLPTDFWILGTGRKIFEVNGVKFGIAICHEYGIY
ncbi:response regulator [Pedobacter frigoris]|uniref:Uncharacterized protein n=1 Tax=Pedobacter frigoris TaxID=2571272 RepID=A0A4U1CP03_9SPHI|nr:hypothetical protein [Pedobacter frigoris]TKC07124.1 hypothetical protein FA047_07645 [Pedobacter frigoris]